MTNEKDLVVTNVNGIDLHLPKREDYFEKIKNHISVLTTEQLQELHILIASEIIDRAVA